MTGNIEDWKLHIHALSEIIRLRGGPESLVSNTQLSLAISWYVAVEVSSHLPLTYSRSDIIGSISLDSTPNFPLLGHVVVESPQPPQDPINIARLWSSKFPDAFEMYDLLTELGRWNTTFENALQLVGDDLFMSFPIAREWGSWDHSVTSLVHSILNNHKEVNFLDEVSVLHEACRLASWLYLAEIRHKCYIRPFDYSVQKSKLRRLLEEHNTDWEGLEKLQFWVLTVAVLQSNAGSERNWFIDRMRTIGVKLGITSKIQADAHLRELLWINDIHGRKLMELQDEIWQ